MMSPNYDKQVTDLTAWFKQEMAGLPPLSTSEDEYRTGTDYLPEGPHKQLVKRAFDTWLTERNYELSYNQMCNAFFSALWSIAPKATRSMP